MMALSGSHQMGTHLTLWEASEGSGLQTHTVNFSLGLINGMQGPEGKPCAGRTQNSACWPEELPSGTRRWALYHLVSTWCHDVEGPGSPRTEIFDEMRPAQCLPRKLLDAVALYLQQKQPIRLCNQRQVGLLKPAPDIPQFQFSSEAASTDCLLKRAVITGLKPGRRGPAMGPDFRGERERERERERWGRWRGDLLRNTSPLCLQLKPQRNAPHMSGFMSSDQKVTVLSTGRLVGPCHFQAEGGSAQQKGLGEQEDTSFNCQLPIMPGQLMTYTCLCLLPPQPTVVPTEPPDITVLGILLPWPSPSSPLPLRWQLARQRCPWVLLALAPVWRAPGVLAVLPHYRVLKHPTAGPLTWLPFLGLILARCAHFQDAPTEAVGPLVEALQVEGAKPLGQSEAPKTGLCDATNKLAWPLVPRLPFAKGGGVPPGGPAPLRANPASHHQVGKAACGAEGLKKTGAPERQWPGPVALMWAVESGGLGGSPVLCLPSASVSPAVKWTNPGPPCASSHARPEQPPRLQKVPRHLGISQHQALTNSCRTSAALTSIPTPCHSGAEGERGPGLPSCLCPSRPVTPTQALPRVLSLRSQARAPPGDHVLHSGRNPPPPCPMTGDVTASLDFSLTSPTLSTWPGFLCPANPIQLTFRAWPGHCLPNLEREGRAGELTGGSLNSGEPSSHPTLNQSLGQGPRPPHRPSSTAENTQLSWPEPCPHPAPELLALFCLLSDSAKSGLLWAPTAALLLLKGSPWEDAPGCDADAEHWVGRVVCMGAPPPRPGLALSSHRFPGEHPAFSERPLPAVGRTSLPLSVPPRLTAKLLELQGHSRGQMRSKQSRPHLTHCPASWPHSGAPPQANSTPSCSPGDGGEVLTWNLLCWVRPAPNPSSQQGVELGRPEAPDQDVGRAPPPRLFQLLVAPGCLAYIQNFRYGDSQGRIPGQTPHLQMRNLKPVYAPGEPGVRRCPVEADPSDFVSPGTERSAPEEGTQETAVLTVFEIHQGIEQKTPCPLRTCIPMQPWERPRKAEQCGRSKTGHWCPVRLEALQQSRAEMWWQLGKEEQFWGGSSREIEELALAPRREQASRYCRAQSQHPQGAEVAGQVLPPSLPFSQLHLPSARGWGGESDIHPGPSPTQSLPGPGGACRGTPGPKHLEHRSTALRAPAQPPRDPVAVTPLPLNLRLLRRRQACGEVGQSQSLQGWVGMPSLLSRDVVTVLETQKLPIRGLDSMQTLGLCQLQTPPNQGGAVRMERTQKCCCKTISLHSVPRYVRVRTALPLPLPQKKAKKQASWRTHWKDCFNPERLGPCPSVSQSTEVASLP
ncbi:hypothetical protein Cadr_000011050 [Camelus dromedarius]|uniref:Uncharacterized protein n=1 Tax=Camelus dromedarius TaxID=9838 RepID=A0A5N4DSP8_CAMDR|nr:hypothetical protein Cadr_000011050 [Camelus dromedarius]